MEAPQKHSREEHFGAASSKRKRVGKPGVDRYINRLYEKPQREALK